MLTEFDQNTIANMTAALEAVCKKIPTDQDTHEFRKQLGDAIVTAAKRGTSNYVDLQSAGLKALDEMLRSRRSHWLTRLLLSFARGSSGGADKDALGSSTGPLSLVEKNPK